MEKGVKYGPFYFFFKTGGKQVENRWKTGGKQVENRWKICTVRMFQTGRKQVQNRCKMATFVCKKLVENR